ncbi:insulinase family protein [Paenibacillus sp. N1-5-1-14]|uniref:EF-P 5-aminopentanol modification-associated protein YfmF n=1 Tax=Paenibacillus radicibacter TaxID=2972488 RepID=UPI002159219A|nr:pitrilysin family protein [Paenibacillus radicibacter]MCR8642127.1 insulinase family protein [Paenibacillus radicibacter]
MSVKPLTFERSTVGKIRVHVLPTNRFKTFAISVYVGRPLDEETVTPTALTPFVLRRGTEELPETQKFRERLDDMYGAGFGFDIYKRGDYQIVQFRMDIINDRFVSSNESLLQQGLNFIGNAVTKPATENGNFRDKYVEAEKSSLQKRIEAIVNDKIRYAAERCLEEMCKDEPYRLHPLGSIKDLESITPDSLFTYYKEWLRQAPIDIYVVGNTTLSEVENYVKQAFHIEAGEPVSYQMQVPAKRKVQERTVVEKLDVGQGKLNMGLRVHTSYSDEDYPALLMYNGVLGGYPHSKLFINVREKNSLAYYVSSRVDGHKGILSIQSGIEIDKYDKAVEIIKNQLEVMKRGEITPSEIEQTAAMLCNHLREVQDSAFEMISFDFNAVLSGKERTVASLLESIKRVNADAIRNIATKVELDTIYFLRDQKGDA